MEFGKHLGKGIWGMADKALPVAYGLAYVVLVIRVLPKEEFGNFVLVQELFLIITGLATAFALNPLLKYAAEDNADQAQVISASFVLNILFLVVCSVLVVGFTSPISAVLRAPGLSSLLLLLPAMFAASFVRNFALVVLQTRFQIKQIFWTDAVHFLGVPVLIWVYSRMHLFDSALDLVYINVITLSASSLLGLWLSRSLVRFTLTPRVEEVKRMWDYGKYSLGGLVSYFVYSKADTFILSSFAGPEQVGVYTSAKVFTRVYDMVTQVVQMFVLPASSRLAGRGDLQSLKDLVEKSITFLTVLLIPVFLLFLVFPHLLVKILYSGRYGEAIPLLQVFSLLTFCIPIVAVATNTLMGLGHARLSFVLSLQILVASLVIYFILIPLFGTMGATIAYVLSSFILAWISVRKMALFVPTTFGEVVRRTNDIRLFVRSRMARLRRHTGEQH